MESSSSFGSTSSNLSSSGVALHNSEQMLEHNRKAGDTAEEVTLTIQQMLGMIEAQVQTIDSASHTAAQMKRTMADVVAAASQRLETVSRLRIAIHNTIFM